MNDETRILKEMIDEARRVAIFTGAGISTESGIPDFRGPEGLWKKVNPGDFGDYVSSEDVRRRAWRRRFEGNSSMASAEPNTGHLAAARLVRIGKTESVITQNVDGLHQRAGVPDDRVIELHGNASYARCLECGERHEFEEFRASFMNEGILPVCRVCGGIVKSATISFGQQLPVEALERAEEEALGCDLFLVMGSSLIVYPAAAIPEIAKRNGALLAIVNNEETGLDMIADLIVNRPIGETMEAAVGLD